MKTAIAVAVLVAASVLAVGLSYALLLLYQVSRNLPSVTDLAATQPSSGTTLYYADRDASGKPMVMARLAAENRQWVALRNINKHLVDATVAVEDHRFYEHRGVDYYGIARAVYRNIASRNSRGEGGSTITQQLARNLGSLGLTREKRLRRKLAEAALAVRIEQTYKKDEILELYLNQIYYGNGAFGVEAASLAYFHRHAKDLTLSQAAALAGMPQRPSVYAVNREAARQRRNAVLRRMVETGKITETASATAENEVLRMYHAIPRGNQVYGAPYFVNYVVAQLVRAYGADAVYSGWSVYTSLDSQMQADAEECLKRGIREQGSASQGCLVSIDPKTGCIRAMVGGVDYGRSQFNRVVQGSRQAGSAFKPIVYAAAIDTGKCTLESTYRDDPNFPWRGTREKWIPKNYGGRYSYRSVSVLSAIRNSLNTVAVKVALDAGTDVVAQYARRLGITTRIDPYPTMALGTSSVRPIELCSAYCAFANEGKRYIPTGILKIEGRAGDTIVTNGPEYADTGLQSSTVESMNTALREVVTNGTGKAASEVPDAHGKTGTTSNNIDAWFAGYTPELVTVVWVARERRSDSGHVSYGEMPGATGGVVCAPIWRDFMLKAVPRQVAANRAGGPQEARQVDAGRTERTSPDAEDGDAAAAPAAPGTPQDPDAAPAPVSPDDTGAPGAGLDANMTAPRTAPRTTAPTQAPERAAEPTVPRADPLDEVVTARLCGESMQRATEWCEATVERRMRRRDIPRACRVHRAPPGE